MKGDNEASYIYDAIDESSCESEKCLKTLLQYNDRASIVEISIFSVS